MESTGKRKIFASISKDFPSYNFLFRYAGIQTEVVVNIGYEEILGKAMRSDGLIVEWKKEMLIRREKVGLLLFALPARRLLLFPE